MQGSIADRKMASGSGNSGGIMPSAEDADSGGSLIYAVIAVLVAVVWLIAIFNKRLKHFINEKCQDCVTSLDTVECKIMACCQPRFQEPEATTTTSTVVATDIVTQQEDFDDVMIVDFVHTSAPPTDNGWDPSPYQAPPPDITPPEEPPPSYYDVVTGNVSVSIG